MRNNKEFIALIAIAFLLILLYISLEFIFLLSKDSFLKKMSLGEQIEIFFSSSFLLLIPVILVLSLIYLICVIFRVEDEVVNSIRQSLLFLFSCFFIVLIFLHFDTFIYTSFKKINIKLNIAHLPVPIRIFGLLCLLSISFFSSRDYLISIYVFLSKKYKSIIGILSIIFILGTIFLYKNLKEYSNRCVKINRQSNEELPNIILFSSDGLDPERMSVYGATRDTTPNIMEFAKSAIIFTQAYGNSLGSSRSSIASILSGTSPLTTKIYDDLGILRGRHSFEHLPAILKKLGYYSANFGEKNQTNPTVMNMLEGFDEINGLKNYLYLSSLLNKLVRIYPVEVYFLRTLFLGRVYNKLTCLCGFKHTLFRTLLDKRMIDSAIRIINNVNRPKFICIHLMGTHLFRKPEIIRSFSYGKKYVDPNDNDFYDDNLLYMDKLFGKLLNALIQSGQYNRTIIVVQTDHPRMMASKENHFHMTPLPLIVRFPSINDNYTCNYPVQYLDIAPSLLKAINVGIPDWLEGKPILYPLHDFTEERIKSRPIVSVTYRMQNIYVVKDNYCLKLILPNFITQLFVLEKLKYVPIKDENKHQECLTSLLEYLKEKGLVFNFDEKKYLLQKNL